VSSVVVLFEGFGRKRFSRRIRLRPPDSRARSDPVGQPRQVLSCVGRREILHRHRVLPRQRSRASAAGSTPDSGARTSQPGGIVVGGLKNISKT